MPVELRREVTLELGGRRVEQLACRSILANHVGDMRRLQSLLLSVHLLLLGRWTNDTAIITNLNRF